MIFTKVYTSIYNFMVYHGISKFMRVYSFMTVYVVQVKYMQVHTMMPLYMIV